MFIVNKKIMKKIKAIIISISLVMFLSNASFAMPKPNINYLSESRILGDQAGMYEGNPDNFPPHSFSVFKRNLGTHIDELITTYNNNEGFKKETYELKGNYKLLIFTEKTPYRIIRGIYILNKNNYSIGYCLLDPMIGRKKNRKTGILEQSFFQNDPVINQIKSLNINSAYLQNSINMPSNSTVTNYEKSHDSFIERYIIGSTSNYDILFLDGFYPKELEENLKPYILESINYNINKL
jgi:hypothetical protein